jgi:hypothetical protein
MVGRLKKENQVLKSRIGASQSVAINETTVDGSQIEKLGGILKNLHGTKNYKWLKEHMILKDFVRICQ